MCRLSESWPLVLALAGLALAQAAADNVQVLFERYCGHRVLKWHWLCSAGE